MWAPFSPTQIPGLAGWWRSDRGLTLATTGTTATGTSPPSVTFTGTPSSAVSWSALTTSIEIDITTGGALGTALFTWNLLGVVQAIGQTTASTFVLGSTGITANFPSGTYSTNNVYTTQVGVSQWNDISGIGTNLTQGTASRCPNYTASDTNFNGLPSLSGVYAATKFLTGTYTTPLQAPYTVLVVEKRTTGSTLTSEVALFGDTTANVAGYSYPYFSLPGWNLLAGAQLHGANASADDYNVHLTAWIFGTTGALYLDNPTTANATGTTGTLQMAGLEMFFATAVGTSISASAPEILVYKGALSPGQISQLFAYFQARYL